jgi:hypothetical protein
MSVVLRVAVRYISYLLGNEKFGFKRFLQPFSPPRLFLSLFPKVVSRKVKDNKASEDA